MLHQCFAYAMYFTGLRVCVDVADFGMLLLQGLGGLKL